MQEMEKSTLVENFELPSRGIIYGNGGFDPRVRLRSMVSTQEMRRQDNPEGTNEVLADIIDECLVDKLPISAYDLHVGDFEYLIHKLRVVSHGKQYKMTVGCPYCAKENPSGSNIVRVEADLQTLKRKEFDPAEFESCLNFKLPVSGKQVQLFMETARLQDIITRKINREQKEADENGYKARPAEMIRLESMIDTIDGKKLSYIELQTEIDNMLVADYNFILNKMFKAKNMIGLDTSLTVTCPRCKRDVKTFFRYSNEFFRPSID